MGSLPLITIELFHILGPLKGEVQEFSQECITIGRHPSCDVHFPNDLKIVSRKHAEIIREGNRFMLIDHSTNGTFINGKRIKEAFLKNGDVLLFAQNGPKISFLSKIVEGKTYTPALQKKTTESFIQNEGLSRISSSDSSEPVQSHTAVPEKEIKVSLIIQYGPTLQTFDRLPIKIGKHPNCNFKITDNPAINDFQAEISYSQNNFMIKDLTGQRSVYINRRAVEGEEMLMPESEVSLSPNGPYFRFIGDGRLAEIEVPIDAVPLKSNEQTGKPDRGNHLEKDSKKGPMAFFKKFIK